MLRRARQLVMILRQKRGCLAMKMLMQLVTKEASRLGERLVPINRKKPILTQVRVLQALNAADLLRKESIYARKCFKTKFISELDEKISCLR